MTERTRAQQRTHAHARVFVRRDDDLAPAEEAGGLSVIHV